LRTTPVTPARKSVARSQPSRIWIQRNQRKNLGEVSQRLNRDDGASRFAGGCNPRKTRNLCSGRRALPRFGSGFTPDHIRMFCSQRNRVQTRGRPRLVGQPFCRDSAFSALGSGCQVSYWPSFTSGSEFSMA
jgi:hypothetical protein